MFQSLARLLLLLAPPYVTPDLPHTLLLLYYARMTEGQQVFGSLTRLLLLLAPKLAAETLSY